MALALAACGGEGGTSSESSTNNTAGPNTDNTAKGSLQATTSSLYDRTLDVYGVQLLVGGAVGSQTEVPDEWAHKIAQSYVMLMDPAAEGINIEATGKNERRSFWGTRYLARRSSYLSAHFKGQFDEYPLNPGQDFNNGDLDAFYGSGTEALLNGAANDMIWYQNSTGDGTFDWRW